MAAPSAPESPGAAPDLCAAETVGYVLGAPMGEPGVPPAGNPPAGGPPPRIDGVGSRPLAWAGTMNCDRAEISAPAPAAPASRRARRVGLKRNMTVAPCRLALRGRGAFTGASRLARNPGLRLWPIAPEHLARHRARGCLPAPLYLTPENLERMPGRSRGCCAPDMQGDFWCSLALAGNAKHVRSDCAHIRSSRFPMAASHTRGMSPERGRPIFP